MAIKDTTKHMRDLLAHITSDLEKADGGNKAASQRVRTGTVKLEKIAKNYRKESIKSEKTTKGTRKPAAKKASSSHGQGHHGHATHGKKAAAKSHAPAKKATVKAKPKAKAAHKGARPHALSFKRPSAKLPARKASR